MIPVIEDHLKSIIDQRLKDLKKNPDIIDRVFTGASVSNRNRLKEYLQSTSIKVTRGYPTDQAVMPCYSILLGRDDQDSEPHGGYMGDDDGYVKIESASETQQVVEHNGMLIIEVDHKPLHGISSIEYAGQVYGDVYWEVLDEQRGYVSLYFDVDPNVSSSVTINYTYVDTGTELYGYTANAKYHIEIWTVNADLTVMMYHLAKWIMLSSKDDMMREFGIYTLTFSGGDLEPRPDMVQGTHVFRRTLILNMKLDITMDREFSFIRDVKLEDGGGENA